MIHLEKKEAGSLIAALIVSLLCLGASTVINGFNMIDTTGMLLGVVLIIIIQTNRKGGDKLTKKESKRG